MKNTTTPRDGNTETELAARERAAYIAAHAEHLATAPGAPCGTVYARPELPGMPAAPGQLDFFA